MNINLKNPIVRIVYSRIRNYDEYNYWKRRREVINPESKVPKIIRLYYLYKIKKTDAFNNASMGTDLGKGANFASTPRLPHGLNGIIISHFATIGHNAVIHQQATIAQKGKLSATIGDNCYIGAGAKIIGSVNIGNDVTIGANCVVIKDVPDNSIAVGIPAKIINKKNSTEEDKLLAEI